MKKKISIIISCLFLVWVSCQKDPKFPIKNIYNPTAYIFTLPSGVSIPTVPSDNPMTLEGIELGRKLFYDVRLSGNNTMACASCHGQEFGFTDKNLAFSKGIDNIAGNRNSMPIFNLAWDKKFFWDGGSPNLETQVIGPLTSTIEMHSNFKDVIFKLNIDPFYKKQFFKAFGTDSITSSLIQKSIAQFERSIISYNSLFDNTYKTQAIREYYLQNPKTRLDSGFQIFAIEDPNNQKPGFHPGHCWHCHGSSPSTRSFTDFAFHNNGLEQVSVDSGRMRITYNALDRGYFKTPSLRNLAFTAPYMHDGRFKNLDEVIDHYDAHVQINPNSDPFAKIDFSKPLNLTPRDKENLKIFLLSLTDSSLITNAAYKSPF